MRGATIETVTIRGVHAVRGRTGKPIPKPRTRRMIHPGGLHMRLPRIVMPQTLRPGQGQELKRPATPRGGQATILAITR